MFIVGRITLWHRPGRTFHKLRALQGLIPTDSLIMFLKPCCDSDILLNFGEREKRNDLLNGILYFQLFLYAFSVSVGHIF